MAIKQEFTADASQAKKAIEELISLNEKLRRENAEMHRETGRGAGEFTKHIGSQLNSLKQMALSYVSVSGAIGLVQGAYEKWSASMDALAAKSTKQNAALVQ